MKVRGWVCFHFQFCKSNFCTARFLLGNQFEFHFIDLIPTAVGSCRVYRYGSIKNETSAWYEGRERERRIERKEKQNSRSAWKEPKVPNPHTGGHTWPRHFLFMIHTQEQQQPDSGAVRSLSIFCLEKVCYLPWKGEQAQQQQQQHKQRNSFFFSRWDHTNFIVNLRKLIAVMM